MFTCQLYLNNAGKTKQKQKKEKHKERETMRSRKTNRHIIGVSDYFWFQAYTHYTHTFLIAFNGNILLPVIQSETVESSPTPPFFIRHRNSSVSPIYIQNSLSSEPDHLPVALPLWPLPTATVSYLGVHDSLLSLSLHLDHCQPTVYSQSISQLPL